jgi:hypothetical protein
VKNLSGDRRRRAGGNRRSAQRKTRPDHRTVAVARSLRRSAVIQEALLAAHGSPLTHEWLAEQTGLPLGFLQWRFPVLDDLRRELVPDGEATDDKGQGG